MHERNAALVVAVVLFGAALTLLLGGVVVALAMGDHMGMMARGRATSQTPAVSDQETVTVEMRSFEFFPRDLTVPAGAKVTWLNKDSAPHDATADDPEWRTSLLQKGAEETLTFDLPGTFSYHCSVHPYMKGTLTVRRSAGD